MLILSKNHDYDTHKQYDAMALIEPPPFEIAGDGAP
jgi:hypothetical protein